MCPPSCPYLSSARAHPPAVLQRRQERDLRFFFPLIADLTESQGRILMFLQSATVDHAATSMPPLLDVEAAEAAAAVAATLETAGKGIIYEHQATSLPGQRLAGRFRAGLDEIMAEAGSRRGALERDAAIALRRLEHGARTAAKALPGDEPPVFLELLKRMLSMREAETDPAEALETDPQTSRLILPG